MANVIDTGGSGQPTIPEENNPNIIRVRLNQRGEPIGLKIPPGYRAVQLNKYREQIEDRTGKYQPGQQLAITPDEWDYKSPPIDPNGRPIGMNGESLPEGAVAWDPYGNPWWGPGIANYMKGVKYRMTKPVSEHPTEASKLLDPARLSNWSYWIRDLGREEGEDPNVLNYLTRGATESVNLVLNALGAPAKAFKQWYGAAVMTADELADYGDLPDIPQFNDWRDWVLKANPLTLGYNTVRWLVADQQDQISVDPQKIWDRNYNASLMAYSAFSDPAAKADFIKRYADGENPYLLAMELENPWAEMIGEFIWDPLWIADLFGGKILKEMKFARSARRYTDVADPDVAKALDAIGTVAGEGASAEHLASLIDSQFASIAARENIVDMTAGTAKDVARRYGIFSQTAQGRRMEASRSAGEMVGWILATTKKNRQFDPDAALEVFTNLAYAASKDKDEVARGVNGLLNFTAPRPLFSEGGNTLGIMLRDLLSDSSGKINPTEFLEEMVKAVGEMPSPKKLAEFIEMKMQPVIKKLWPDVNDLEKMAKAGGEAGEIARKQLAMIPEYVKVVNKFHNNSQKIYGPLNRFFSKVYMGMSPGYAFRNGMQNILQSLIDLGPTGGAVVAKATVEGVLNPVNAANRKKSAVEKILGGMIPTHYTLGYGPHHSLDIAFDTAGNIKLNPEVMLRISENAESAASTGIVYRSLVDTMGKFLKEGKGLPGRAKLIEAGFTNAQCDQIYRVIRHTWGDVDEALEILKNATKAGDIEAWRIAENWMSASDIKFFDDAGWMPEIRETLQLPTLEEAKTKMKQILDEVVEKAKAAKSEIRGVDESNDAIRSVSALGEARNSGWLSDESVNVFENQVGWNAETTRRLDNAIDDVGIEHITLAAEAGDREAVTALRKLYQDTKKLLAGMRDKAHLDDDQFIESVWQLTRKIKGSKTLTPEELQELWRKSMLIVARGEPPAGLSKQSFLDHLWDKFTRPNRREYWTNFREAYMEQANNYFDELARLSGVDVTQAPEVERAMEALDMARYWDDPEILPNGLYIGKKRGVAWDVAREMGMDAEFEGERHLLGAINKRLPPAPEGMPAPVKYKRLSEVPEETVRYALEQRAATAPAAKGAKEAAAPAAKVAEEVAPKGWKLHLATDNVDEVAKYADENGLIYKVGRSSEQQGKDVTVYVGSRAEAERIANKINDDIPDLLKEPFGDAAKDDIKLADKVVGRFDPRDPEFHQYGAEGIPWLKDDVTQVLQGVMTKEEATARAKRRLIEKYGDEFGATIEEAAAPAAKAAEEVAPVAIQNARKIIDDAVAEGKAWEIGDYVYFRQGDGGDLFKIRADQISHMDPTTGMPVGARWEAPPHLIDDALELARKAAGEGAEEVAQPTIVRASQSHAPTPLQLASREFDNTNPGVIDKLDDAIFTYPKRGKMSRRKFVELAAEDPEIELVRTGASKKYPYTWEDKLSGEKYGATAKEAKYYNFLRKKLEEGEDAATRAWRLERIAEGKPRLDYLGMWAGAEGSTGTKFGWADDVGEYHNFDLKTTSMGRKLQPKDYSVSVPKGHRKPPDDIIEEAKRMLEPVPAEAVPRAAEAVEPTMMRAATNKTKAISTDSKSTYDFEVRVVELDDMITSHIGNNLDENPAFPQELQPRLRDREASKAQIQEIINEFNPETLTVDTHRVDTGPMIISNDFIVESGNGRTLALRKMREEYPELWDQYIAALRAELPNYGLSEDVLEGIKNPVLVRERVTPLDDVTRQAYVRDANKGTVMQMSTMEKALEESRVLDDELLSLLTVGEKQSIDQALMSTSNEDFVRNFLNSIPLNERTALVDAEGRLNEEGLTRLKNALFARTYPGKSGKRLLQVFSESVDPGSKNIEAAMYASLPDIARMESAVRVGSVSADYSIADDLSKVVDVYARLKQQKISIEDYLAQLTMFDVELNEFQRELLRVFSENVRSEKNLRWLMKDYARRVMEQPDPRQMSMFAVKKYTKGELLDEAIKEIRKSVDESPLFATLEEGAPAPVARGGEELAGPVTRGEEAAEGATRAPTEPEPEPGAVAGIGEEAAPATPTEPVAPAEPTPLTPPPPTGAPSDAHMLDQSLDGIKRAFNRMEKGLEDNWGKLKPMPSNRTMDKALNEWGKEAYKRVAEGRLMASQVANATRDFALLNYTDKRYFDLALAYIFPYHFWYTRTYANWLQRLAFDPKIIAGYAQYKEMLAKIHAGSPDWWKYTLNTNELLGLDSEHPLFFNLEATLNPLNGLTGVDFDDPERRVDWLTNTLDGLGKFGPSTWTPFSIATAVSLYMRGEKEAAARWGSRLVPQTATIKSLTSLLNIGPKGGLELDPNVWFFSGGMDPYERRRVGRALGTLMEQGVPEADLIDAANTQEGPVWEAAMDLATKARAPGQLSSFFLGVGFKARSELDLQIDKFYQDQRYLWAMEPNLSPEEFQKGMDQLWERYPYGNLILLSRKGGIARDRSFAYNVLGRIGPGQKNDVAEAVGIDPRLLSKFYDEKGHIENWDETDRTRFMAGITDIGALLDIPGDATRKEWNEASRTYSKMLENGRKQFGTDIDDLVSAYFAAKGDDKASKEAAEAILQAHPQIGEYLDWRTTYVMATPILNAYYGGLGVVENYYNGLFYNQVEKELGADLWNKIDEYYLLKDSGGDYRAYSQANPELKAYWEMKEQHRQLIARVLAEAGTKIQETKPMTLRPGATAGATSLGEQDLIESMGAEETPVLSWEQWQEILPEELSNVLYLSAMRGQPIPQAALDQLWDAAENFNIDPDYLVDQIEASIGY